MLKALILKPMYHSFQAPAPSVYRPDFNITTASLEMDEVGWGSGKLLSDTSLE